MAPNNERISVEAAIRRNRNRKDFAIDSLRSLPFNKKENVVLTMKMNGKMLTQSPFKILGDTADRHFSFRHPK